MAAGQIWALIGFFAWLAGAVASVLVAVVVWRKPARGPERGALVVALALSAGWCVTCAAWGAHSTAATTLDAARNLGWITVLYRLFSNDGRDRSQAPIRPLVTALCLVECLQPGMALFAASYARQPAALEAILPMVAATRAMVAIGALVLLHNLYAGASAAARQVLRWPAAALAGTWAYQLNLYTVAWFAGSWPRELVVLHGLVAAATALLIAVGANARAADLRLSPSRTVAFQTLSLVVIGAYLAAMLVLSRSLSLLGGDFARLTQVAFLAAAAATATLWLPSRRLRGWLRVKLFKHLFQHRYDYRAEWLRFTGTIGRAAPDAPALPDRAAQALADITDSQGAFLLLPGDDGEFQLAGHWQWPHAVVPAQPLPAALVAELEASGAILELDAMRGAGDGAIPAWLTDEPRAWAAVPLLHFDRMVGLAVLARPAVARRLDWEDFDLLKIVGRQLASYLAEQAGHAALMEAARFDEFNRRIAFVMHDIKNLASQLALLARNAERHADNPHFRQDMLLTLASSSAKLNALLARLSRYGAAGQGARAPTDLVEIVRRVAARHAGGHPVRLTRADRCTVIADADALEQALAHLVQNAIEASPAGSPVYLDVTSDGLRGRIDVIDAGAGMNARFVRDGLFRPFVSSKDGGFGIGAFEARALVRGMGGRLDVESREGVGTRFIIQLPLAAAMELSGRADAMQGAAV